MNCFGPRKVVHSSHLAIGEITILLPLKRTDPLFDNENVRERTQIQIACPVEVNVKNLKKRISGKIKCIPADNIRLTFCGDVLRDDENVPLQVFEQTEKVREDVDVFRPRVVMTIRHPVVVEEEEEGKKNNIKNLFGGFMGSKGISTEKELTPEEQAARDAALGAELERIRLEEEEDAARAEEEEAQKKAKLELEREAKRARDEAAMLAFTNFDLRDELSKIDCEMFYPQFRDACFLDEGSFGALTEEDLQSRIVIPRAARLRILALIDAVRRRLELIAHQSTITVADQVQQNMLQNNQMGTMTVGSDSGSGEADWEAMDLDEEDAAELAKAQGYFTNKTQLKKAWEIKQKLLAKYRAKLAAIGMKPKEVPKKQHSNEIMAKMAAIRRRCECDEFGIPKSSEYLLEQHFARSTNPRIVAKQMAAEAAAHRPHAHLDESTPTKPPVGKPGTIAQLTSFSIDIGGDARRHSLSSQKSVPGSMSMHTSSNMVLKSKSGYNLYNHHNSGDDGSVGSGSQGSDNHHHHHHRIHDIAGEEEAEFAEGQGDPKLAAAFHWKYEPDEPFCW